MMRSLVMSLLLGSVVGLRRRLVVPSDLLVVPLTDIGPLDRAQPVGARRVPNRGDRVLGGSISWGRRAWPIGIPLDRHRHGLYRTDRVILALTSRGDPG